MKLLTQRILGDSRVGIQPYLVASIVPMIGTYIYATNDEADTSGRHPVRQDLRESHGRKNTEDDRPQNHSNYRMQQAPSTEQKSSTLVELHNAPM